MGDTSLSSEVPRSVLPSRLIWLAIPTLAIIAYAPTLGIWFLSDDFQLLHFHTTFPWPLPFTTFNFGPGYYRPLSMTLTFYAGYALFGTNSLPYHLVSLALHALAAYLLARGVAVISNSPRIGWLTGAIFAVYPLSVEPLTWLAAQWDIWAAVCGLGAVWAFAYDWRSSAGGSRSGTRTHFLYWCSVGLFGFGMFMKESILPLALLMPVVALATELTPSIGEDPGSSATPIDWLRLFGRSLWRTVPFLLLLGIYLGLRWVTRPTGATVPSTFPTDFEHFFWDTFVAATRQALEPLNRQVFSLTLTQVIGLLMSGLVLLSLIANGRRRWPLLMLALFWFPIMLAPELGLLHVSLDEQNSANRYFYLPLIGLYMILAALASSFLELPVRRRVRYGAGIMTLALGIGVVWLQLRPWLHASGQAQSIIAEMARMAPPVTSPLVTYTINVQDIPSSYQGAYLLPPYEYSEAMQFVNKMQVREVQSVQTLGDQSLTAPLPPTAGVLNIAYELNPADQMFRIHEMAGVAGSVDPPTVTVGIKGMGGDWVWDFRKCTTPEPAWRDWQPVYGQWQCGEADLSGGTWLTPTLTLTEHVSSVMTSLSANSLAGVRWVRLGLCVRTTALAGRFGQWFWSDQNQANQSWTDTDSQRFGLTADGTWRTYWTYIPIGRIGRALRGIRLDPVNQSATSEIRWISITLVQ